MQKGEVQDKNVLFKQVDKFFLGQQRFDFNIPSGKRRALVPSSTPVDPKPWVGK